MPFVTYTRSLTKDVGLEKKDEMTVSQRVCNKQLLYENLVYSFIFFKMCDDCKWMLYFFPLNNTAPSKDKAMKERKWSFQNAAQHE